MDPRRGFGIDYLKFKNSELRSQKSEEHECRFTPAIIMARAEVKHLILNPESWLLAPDSWIRLQNVSGMAN